jgi:cupin superfamily acireductone dioxygenase involved in methionine salvage
MEISLLILSLILSIVLIYQTKILREISKDREFLKKRVSDIEENIDDEVEKKRARVLELKREIEELQKRANYIEADQIELNREYEYLQERNRKLEQSIISVEELERRD